MVSHMDPFEDKRQLGNGLLDQCALKVNPSALLSSQFGGLQAIVRQYPTVVRVRGIVKILKSLNIALWRGVSLNTLR